MSRMAKRYQGVRAGQMFDILQSENAKRQSTSLNSETRNQPTSEKAKCAGITQSSKERLKIIRSYSLSNITNRINTKTERRCSSVPPTIKVQYEPRNKFNIDSDVYCSSKNGLSLSLSALTCDDIKETNNKRCSSVPPSYYRYIFKPVESYVVLGNLAHPSYLLDEASSFNGDYSDGGSDVTYCPSDGELNLYSSSPELLRDEPSTSSGIFHGNTNEGRKRQHKADPNEWKKNKNRKLRMQGKDYLGYTKPKDRKLKQDKLRLARQLRSRCISQFCRKSKVRNCEKFCDEKRSEIHKIFWENMNWDQRKVYVTGLVTRKKTSRKTSDLTSRREGTFDYYLPKNENIKLQVCRTTFLNTLCLGSYTVQSWVKKARYGALPCQDIQNQARVKTPRSGTQRKILTAGSFLDNIPKLPSHYARKESSKLYLEPVYRSLSDLYSRYKEYCTRNEEPVVCRFTFEKIFNDKNLSLYTLKKDMCDICSGHAVGNVSNSDYEQHIRRKNRARQEKETDKKKALSGDFILLSMDLESVKVCPYLTASALYFKTKLSCHNFTIYDLVTHHASCYWFDETCADLTASTFASFVIDYLERYCLPKGLPIIIYSDGCTYQNRNSIIANALLNVSIENNVSITQKYLEPGHTQMECDSVHAAIERKLKNREIHVPSDYISVTKEARKNPSSYEAIQVNFNFVKDYSDKLTWRYSSIRPGRKAGDPVVVDLRAIQYKPDGIISYKINYDDDWSQLPLRPKKLISISYSILHTAPIPISSIKFNHLQQLKEVLPRDCHLFYDNLAHE